MKAKPTKKSEARAQANLAEQFNRAHAVGTRVRYWPTGLGEQAGAWRESLTRGPAFLLGGHTACVHLAGVGAAVALSHVEVIGGEP